MRESADRGYDCLLVSDARRAAIEGLHSASVDMVGTEGGIFGATCTTSDLLGVLEGMEQ
jgi:biuret amidohydrolase